MPEESRDRTALAMTLPRQHGAWSILLACFVIGTLVGNTLNLRVPLVFFAVIFGFLARHGVGVYSRAPRTDDRKNRVLIWTSIYSLVVLTAGGLLVIVHELWQLLPLGLIIFAFGFATLVLSQRRMETTAGGELVGILGLTLVAPAAEYVASGLFSSQTVGLWILCAFFFCGSVFHVRYLVRRRAESVGPLSVRLKAGWPSVVYHLVVLCISVVLGSAGMIPLLSPVALLPAALKAWVAVGRRVRTPLPVRWIGVIEVLCTIAFLVLVVFVFRMS